LFQPKRMDIRVRKPTCRIVGGGSTNSKFLSRQRKERHGPLRADIIIYISVISWSCRNIKAIIKRELPPHYRDGVSDTGHLPRALIRLPTHIERSPRVQIHPSDTGTDTPVILHRLYYRGAALFECSSEADGDGKSERASRWMVKKNRRAALGNDERYRSRGKRQRSTEVKRANTHL
jgi:hypothetical protein